jgi:predicted metal-dependent hydrolase
MVTQIQVGGIVLDVVMKDIKNVHLSVNPPGGRVRIAAPLRMSAETIRVFAISKLPWIRREQQKLQTQDRESPREFLDRESQYVWGKRYLLRIIDTESAPSVRLRHSTIDLSIRTQADAARRQAVLEAWYREEIKSKTPELLAKWAPRLGVVSPKVFVQKMKTKWGSCSPTRGTIRLNTDLAKRPPRCLEYVVVHELSHLVERKHNDRFAALLDQHLPTWRSIRDELNLGPLSHQVWDR